MTTRVEQINNVAIEYGKVLLAERPALYPFAAVLLPNGDKSMMSLTFEDVTANEVEERLIAGLSEDATDGAIVAASWGYTVDITSDEGTFPALKVLAEARGEAPQTTYVPYQLLDGRGPVFGTPVPGPARDAVVFLTRPTKKAAVRRVAPKKKAAAPKKKKSAAARKPAARKPVKKAKGKKGRR